MLMWSPYNQMNGLAFHLDYNFEWQSTDLRIVERHDGVTKMGVLTFVEKKEGDRMEPTLRVRDRENGDAMQDLFNLLWHAGYRPESRMKQDDILGAKDAHLEDLRTLLFKARGIDPTGAN